MFKLGLTPVFGQERQPLYALAYQNPTARASAPFEERIGDILQFMEDKIPNYHSNASSLETALHMGVANCMSRTMVIHTLLSPFDDIEPIIELQRFGRDIHARNLILARNDLNIIELENGFKDIEPIMSSVTQPARERTHPAIITIVRPELLDAITYRERGSLYGNLRSGTGFSSFITSLPEQRFVLGSKPENNDTTLLHRNAANMLIDTLTGTQRSAEHRKTYRNFMKFAGRPVSTSV